MTWPLEASNGGPRVGREGMLAGEPADVADLAQHVLKDMDESAAETVAAVILGSG